MKSTWASGDAYEPYIGRWSRLVAQEFLHWLELPAGGRWLDVGCGTGALTQTVIDMAAPSQVAGVDPSEEFVSHADARVRDATFRVAGAEALPFPDGAFDAVVSGLMLNFVPDPAAAVREMTRVVGQGGLVGAYVWDYAGRMDMIRHFWDAAGELDSRARALDEGVRFPLCSPDRLEELFAGLRDVGMRAIDVPTGFRDFDEYWQPFLGGQGPAPSYCVSLDQRARDELRDLLRRRIPVERDGSIRLIARAWAVSGLS